MRTIAIKARALVASMAVRPLRFSNDGNLIDDAAGDKEVSDASAR